MCSNVKWNDDKPLLRTAYWTILLLLAIRMATFIDMKRNPVYRIYWNSSNDIFHHNNSNVLEVNMYDSIEIICPRYSHYRRGMEYYVIYWVSHTSYDRCIVNANQIGQKTTVLNCSEPLEPRFAIILIRDIQPQAGRPDFTVGEKYYFILKTALPNTTSTAELASRRPTTTTTTTTTISSRAPNSRNGGSAGSTPRGARVPPTRLRNGDNAPPGGDFNYDNIIHVGNDNRNSGTITDSGTIRRFQLKSIVVLLSVFALQAR